jgi:hypothetical protein
MSKVVEEDRLRPGTGTHAVALNDHIHPDLQLDDDTIIDRKDPENRRV